MSTDVDLYKFKKTICHEDALDWVLSHGRPVQGYVIDVDDAPDEVKGELREIGEETEDSTLMIIIQ